MKPKLLELAEVLKQKPEIKERLERLEFGCWISTDEREVEELVRIISVEENIVFTEPTEYNTDCFDKKELVTGVGLNDEIIKIIGCEPQYSDVLEYLGDGYYISYNYLVLIKPDFSECESNELEDVEVKLSPGPLSDQTDETLDDIISLLKTVGKNK